MSKKIVANGTRVPYENAPIDQEIIRLTGKEYPNF